MADERILGEGDIVEKVLFEMDGFGKENFRTPKGFVFSC